MYMPQASRYASPIRQRFSKKKNASFLLTTQTSVRKQSKHLRQSVLFFKYCVKSALIYTKHIVINYCKLTPLLKVFHLIPLTNTATQQRFAPYAKPINNSVQKIQDESLTVLHICHRLLAMHGQFASLISSNDAKQREKKKEQSKHLCRLVIVF